jgi:dihydrofolate reductase
MKKLKLQVQISVDGFVARPKGELDWMTWDWDDELKNYVEDLHDLVDIILMGRKMTAGFISYWEDYVKNKPDSPEYPFANKMVDYPKIVFTKTLNKSEWKNTTLAKGNLVDEINQLKKQDGKDMIVYGGATFVSSLIKDNLIDEYYLFINPIAIGKGMTIFGNLKDTMGLNLMQSKTFKCGIVVNQYEPNNR